MAGVWLKPEKGSEEIKAEKGPLRGANITSF